MTRKVIKNLKLGEISGVTVPAQSHALAAIMKSADSPVVAALVKYINIDDGAKTFTEFFADDEACRQKWKARDKVWPALYSLEQTVNSIVADKTISGSEKTSRIETAAGEFVGSIHDIIPDVEQELLKAFSSEDGSKPKEKDKMSDEQIAALNKQVADLTADNARLATVAKFGADERSHYDSLNDAGKLAFVAKSDADRKNEITVAKAADETVSVDGKEIRKSAVGADAFALIKSQSEKIAKDAEDLAKAKADALNVTLTKRAEDELAALPGETVAKVAVLAAVEKMADAEKATLTAMLKAGNDAQAGAFVTIGKAVSAADITKQAKVAALVKAYKEANPTATDASAQVAVLEANPGLYE